MLRRVGGYKLPYPSGSAYQVTQAYNPSAGMARCQHSVTGVFVDDPACSHNVNPNHHHAVDFALPLNTPILASRSGTVFFTGYNSVYGNYVKVRHDNDSGKITLYAHLNSISVNSGQNVSQGEEVGKSGNTPLSPSQGNYHLHFEHRSSDSLSDQINIPIVFDEIGGLAVASQWYTSQNSSSTPTPNQFQVGDRIKTVNTDNVQAVGLSIRDNPGLNTNVISQPNWGATGKIKDSASTGYPNPTVADGHTWWYIDYDIGVTGWSSEKYLEKDTSNPTNPPSNPTNNKATIKLNNTNSCIDLKANAVTQNQPLQLYNCNNGVAQEWLLPMNVSQSTGTGQIKLAQNPDYCLDIDAVSTNPANGTGLILAKCDNGQFSATGWVFNSNGLISTQAQPNGVSYLYR